MKIKCETCKKFKHGIKLIIEHHDKRLNSTKRITENTCFDCLMNEPVIKINFKQYFVAGD